MNIGKEAQLLLLETEFRFTNNFAEPLNELYSLLLKFFRNFRIFTGIK